MEKLTNNELFNELKQRGFYVSKVSQDEEAGVDYLIVSAEATKVKEVIYSDIKEWPISSNIGQQD